MSQERLSRDRLTRDRGTDAECRLNERVERVEDMHRQVVAYA